MIKKIMNYLAILSILIAFTGCIPAPFNLTKEAMVDVDKEKYYETKQENTDSQLIGEDQTNDDKELTQNPNENLGINNDAEHIMNTNLLSIKEESMYNFNEEKAVVVEKPHSQYVLVNKFNELPSDFVPDHLVIPNVPFSFDGENEKKYMNKQAAVALETLVQEGLNQGLEIVAVSGYRSYDRQDTIYNYNVSRMGEEATNKVSAKPGQSEHQTGLAMDVSSIAVGYGLVESFGETNEGIWLAENAHQFGFIIRYPKDKTEITKYNYEPWHLRYVGIDLATYLYEENLTLDEFYSIGQ